MRVKKKTMKCTGKMCGGKWVQSFQVSSYTFPEEKFCTDPEARKGYI